MFKIPMLPPMTSEPRFVEASTRDFVDPLQPPPGNAGAEQALLLQQLPQQAQTRGFAMPEPPAPDAPSRQELREAAKLRVRAARARYRLLTGRHNRSNGPVYTRLNGHDPAKTQAWRASVALTASRALDPEGRPYVDAQGGIDTTRFQRERRQRLAMNFSPDNGRSHPFRSTLPDGSVRGDYNGYLHYQSECRARTVEDAEGRPVYLDPVSGQVDGIAYRRDQHREREIRRMQRLAGPMIDP